MNKILKDKVGHISDDIFIQGSRVSGTAKPTSDIDIGMRVSEEHFNELIIKYFNSPNPGSAKERTMNHAIETGKIQAGEVKLSGFRKELKNFLGMNVDLSVIKKDGPFDTPPFIQINK